MGTGTVNYGAPDRLCHRALGRINHRGPGRVSRMMLGKVYSKGPGSTRHRRPGRVSHGMVWCVTSPRLWMVRSRPFTIGVGKGYHNWCSCDHSKDIKCGYNGYRKKFHVDLVYNGLF